MTTPGSSNGGRPVRFRGERRMFIAVGYRGWHYWLGTIGWILYFASPIVPGWLTGRLFDAFQRHERGSFTAMLIVSLALSELALIWGLAVAHRTYVRGVESSKALMRANVMHAQLASGNGEAAARNLPVGDVLVRMRDDPFDTLFLLDNWVDLLGSSIYGAVAFWFLARIDLLAAVVGVAPLMTVGWGNKFIATMARRFRARARESSSNVSSFLNAAFEASLTIKVAGAQHDVLRRLDDLNDERSHASVRDSVWNELLWTTNGTVADVFVGISLVVAARGTLTAGEVAQYFAYLVGLSWLPMRIGGLIAGRRRYSVSEARLDALVPAQRPDRVDPLVGHRPLPVLGGEPVDGPELSERQPLERLDVAGLTLTGRGLNDVTFGLDRGTLTVISGPVGSGKSSLLRAVVGLIGIDAGEVRWNGRTVADRAAFFVPPQCAYVAQVPRLFAESLADNLRLGHDLDDDTLLAGVRLAAFEDDLAQLPDGLSTVVGARGVRLSGGQVQRAAGARAMAQLPELLVLDDLTSALDVETEQRLWERLATAGFTVLAASNRPVALARADQVIELRR